MFRAGKVASRAIIEYEANLENNLINLCLSLNNGTYKHDSYSHKILSDKKRRDIAVASVADRVVHRLLYDYLVNIADKSFDPDVWSGRTGKGLHKSLTRIASLTDKYAPCWVWRADIAKFFDNVDKRVLKTCLSRYVTDEKVKNLLDKVIDSYTTQLTVSQSGHGHPYWQSDQSNICQYLSQ